MAIIGIFVDDTQIMREIATEVDASNLQADLESLFEWAEQNNMKFRGFRGCGIY